MQIDQAIDDFQFTTTDNDSLRFSQLKGHNLVLYFYPKDDTPGCTQEGHDFKTLYKKFQQYDTLILGVSRDNLASHHKFKDKHCFPFALITDSDETLCNYFDVIKMKNMYGKQVRGIERSTFLIDKKGILRNEWRKVNVNGHAEEVLTTVAKLNSE